MSDATPVLVYSNRNAEKETIYSTWVIKRSRLTRFLIQFNCAVCLADTLYRSLGYFQTRLWQVSLLRRRRLYTRVFPMWGSPCSLPAQTSAATSRSARTSWPTSGGCPCCRTHPRHDLPCVLVRILHRLNATLTVRKTPNSSYLLQLLSRLGFDFPLFCVFSRLHPRTRFTC